MHVQPRAGRRCLRPPGRCGPSVQNHWARAMCQGLGEARDMEWEVNCKERRFAAPGGLALKSSFGFGLGAGVG